MSTINTLIAEDYIAWTPLYEEQCSMRSIYSMIPIVQIISFVFEIETSINGVGNKQESEREKKNRLRE